MDFSHSCYAEILKRIKINFNKIFRKQDEYKKLLYFYALVNEQPRNEIKKTTALQRIKYLRNLTKEVQKGKLLNIVDGNLRSKKVEKHYTFMD